METINKFLEIKLISIADYEIRIYSLVALFIFFLITKLLLWIIKKTLFRSQNAKKLDSGNAYALFQIIRYAVWVVAIGFMLETIGVKLTVLIAGSAALLVA